MSSHASEIKDWTQGSSKSAFTFTDDGQYVIKTLSKENQLPRYYDNLMQLKKFMNKNGLNKFIVDFKDVKGNGSPTPGLKSYAARRGICDMAIFFERYKDDPGVLKTVSTALIVWLGKLGTSRPLLRRHAFYDAKVANICLFSLSPPTFRIIDIEGIYTRPQGVHSVDWRNVYPATWGGMTEASYPADHMEDVVDNYLKGDVQTYLQKELLGSYVSNAKFLAGQGSYELSAGKVSADGPNAAEIMKVFNGVIIRMTMLGVKELYEHVSGQKLSSPAITEAERAVEQEILRTEERGAYSDFSAQSERATVAQ